MNGIFEQLPSRKFNITHRYSGSDLNLHKAVYEEGCILPQHYHEEPRLVVVSHGHFVETTRAATPVVCRSSTLIIRAAGEKHGNAFQNGPAACITIKLGESWIERFFHLLLVSGTRFCEGVRVSQLAADLNSELIQKDSVTALAIEAIVLELGVQAHRSHLQGPFHASSGWLGEVTNFMDSHFPEQVTLKDMAAAVSIHPVHVLRTFRSRFGYTPAEYLRRRRIDYACDLLLTTRRTIVEISQTCGFSDQSHFTRLFRRYTGTTPARFRRNQKSHSR